MVEAILSGVRRGGASEGGLAAGARQAPCWRTLHGPVTFVEKVVDAASGTCGVRIENPNPDYSIPVGLEWTVEIALAAGG
jgi:hypothetical protein